VLSGRNIAAAQLDIACTVARDAERGVVRLKEAVPEFQAEHVLAFMNRLSDSLFILARVLDGGEHTTVDYGVFGAGST
jgi:cob(I)alamin adenosyltransferase